MKAFLTLSCTLLSLPLLANNPNTTSAKQHSQNTTEQSHSTKHSKNKQKKHPANSTAEHNQSDCPASNRPCDTKPCEQDTKTQECKKQEDGQVPCIPQECPAEECKPASTEPAQQNSTSNTNTSKSQREIASSTEATSKASTNSQNTTRTSSESNTSSATSKAHNESTNTDSANSRSTISSAANESTNNTQATTRTQTRTQSTASTDANSNNTASSTNVDITRVSEAFGHVIHSNFIANPNFTFDFEAIIRGMRQAANGQSSPLSEEACMQAMTSIQDEAFARLAEQNLDEANLFMNLNAKRSGVTCLEPGRVHYKVTRPGTGSQVTENSRPTLHYTGKYIDGTSFGSSKDTGAPITVSLSDIIPGFHKGLIGMHKGEKRTIYVHPDEAYGLEGDLLPNALLVFDVEMLDTGTPTEATAENERNSSGFSDAEFDEMSKYLGNPANTGNSSSNSSI